MKIAVIGDEDTVAGFKLAGVPMGRVANTPSEVEEALREVERDEDVAIVIITEEAASMARQALQEMYLRPRPAIVEVPSKRTLGRPREDPMRGLLKRAIGVEVAIK